MGYYKSLKVYTFLILSILIFSCKSKPENNFEIEGTIINNPENIKKLYIGYKTVGDSSVMDSVTITNNKFYYEGILDESASHIRISTQPKFYIEYIFHPLIESGLNQLEINLENLDFINLKDTPLQKEYELLRPFRINEKKLNDLWAIQSNDTLTLEQRQLADSLILFNINYSKAFIRKTQPSYVTVSEMPLVFDLGGAEGKMIIDSILVILPESFKNNPNVIYMNDKIEEERIKASQISDVGQPAPDFSLPDINGKTVSLSNFKGKYVLIDFWASSCGPCRDDIPFVKYIYKEYHKKGLEVLAISIYDKKEDWIKAIQKEETQMFIQTIEPINSKKGMESVIKVYYVETIPTKILIDQNGIIVGRWEGSGEENKEEIEKILKEYTK